MVPLYDLIAADLRCRGPPLSLQNLLSHLDTELEGLFRVVADHQIPVGIGAGGAAAERLGPVGIRKDIVRVTVPLHYRQRRVESHPENQIGELAQPASHIAADPA